MPPRGSRRSLDGADGADPVYSVMHPGVKTKYGTVYVKSSVDGVASGTLPDVVSQTYPQHGQPANGSRRSSIAGHVGGGVGERRGDGLPVGFTRSRKSLSMHYQQEGSPVSELTGKMVHKINGGFPHSSPAAAAHAAEKEKAKTASPPSVSSPMSLLAHRRAPRRMTMHHVPASTSTNTTTSTTTTTSGEVPSSPPHGGSGRGRRRVSEMSPFLLHTQMSPDAAEAVGRSGSGAVVYSTDLVDDLSLLMDDMGRSPDHAFNEEILTKEEARRKNASSFNMQVKRAAAEKAAKMKDVKSRALSKITAMRKMALLRSASSVDILKYKSEPISASNHSLECGMAIRPGARAATVVAFSPSGHLLAVSGADGVIRVFDTVRYKQLRTLDAHVNWVMGMAWSPDGSTLVSTSDDKSIVAWSTKTWAPLHTIQGNNSAVRCCAFSPDGQFLVASSPDAASAVNVYETRTWAVVEEMSGHADMIRCAAFHPDGVMLATGADDNVVKVWHTSLWTPVRDLESRGHTDGVMCLAFNEQGSLLVSGSADRTLIVWDSHTWAPMQVLSGHTDAVLSVAFAPSSGLLASGSSDGGVRLWETKGWKMVRTLGGHKDFVQGLAFHPNGKLLVSASFDKTLRMWV